MFIVEIFDVILYLNVYLTTLHELQMLFYLSP
jgi:hypothetical protein